MRRAAALALLPLLAACQALPAMRGANFVQSATVPWEGPAAAEALARLRRAGANWVAFVPFLAQSAPDACDLAPTEHSAPGPLAVAIRQARAQGLAVAVKPQVLVPGSWAGEVAPAVEAGWACWFAAYRRGVLPYAELARDAGAELFVIGTELKATEARPEWRELAAALRAAYPGPLSYVFHDVGDVAGFAGLEDLDRVAVSLYPAIGNDPGRWPERIAEARDRLRAAAAGLSKRLWIGEIGYPSRRDAGDNPWEWHARVPAPVVADSGAQARVLGLWLDELNGGWNEGVLLWHWSSDPQAGGPADSDFTPQNKPAEREIACRWRGEACRD
jgi:hypothetical protein